METTKNIYNVDNLENKAVEYLKKGRTLKDMIRYVQISTIIDVYRGETILYKPEVGKKTFGEDIMKHFNDMIVMFSETLKQLDRK